MLERKDRGHHPLYVAAFIGGVGTMAVEMAASRLLAPYFGDSILVWANLIGLVLISLAAGGYLGGRWADAHPRVETLYTIVAVAALGVGVAPLLARPVLRVAQRAFAHIVTGPTAFEAVQIGGSFVAVLALFVPPVVLLGSVSPFAIRLATHYIRTAGSSAGRIYALSTLGSIFGTFVPVLVTIPLVGTMRTFYLTALLLAAVAFAALLPRRPRRAWLVGLLCLSLLALTLLPARVKSDDDVIYEEESRYNYIQVVQHGSTRYLLLNEGQGIHSVYDPRTLQTLGSWDVMTVAPFFNPAPFAAAQVHRICVVGLAAGTVARQSTAVYGAVPIDGVEIDPAIVAVGRRFFAMDMPNLNVFVADGRFFLEHSDQKYDLIVLDAYRLPHLPFHLATTEFFALVAERLTPDGVVAINVGRTESDYRMVEAVAATLRPYFASVYAVNIKDTFNTVLVAVRARSKPEDLRANALASGDPFVRATMDRALHNLHPLTGNGIVFTDDRAPVESLTNAIILRYLIWGE